MGKSEMMKHTKEPWVADLRSGCCAIYPKDKTEDSKGCHRDDDRNICFSSKGSRYIESPKGSRWDMDDQTRVDFKRIVACVNACEGINDAVIEEGIIEKALVAYLGSYDKNMTWNGMKVWEDV